LWSKENIYYIDQIENLRCKVVEVIFGKEMIKEKSSIISLQNNEQNSN
jgi:hypothetical protein